MGVTVNTLPALNNNNSFNVDGVTVTSKHRSGSAGFVSVWDTTRTSTGSSTSTQVKLPLVSNGTYNFTVDWGDGNTDVITTYNQSEVTHTYSSSGEYTITITGTINGWRFNDSGDKLKIGDISSFGPLNIKDTRAFRNCTNLTISATDELGTTGLTDALYMFGYCESLTIVPLFDLSSVTSTGGMFDGCTSLTTVPLFDLSSVSSALFMFNGCTSLTTVPLFDLSSVTDATYIFNDCTLSTASYSAFLEHLDTLSLQSGVGFHGGNSKYNTGGQTARTNIINDHSWTFTDGGLA